MKEFFKRFGLIFIFLGVVLLVYSEFTKAENNQLLLFSGILILGGLLIYVILNNVLE